MKKLPILFLSLLLINTGCQQTPPPTPSPNPNPQSTMTPWETSLVGQWKLKRSETRMNTYQAGLGDSTMGYTNHYNYNNSQLELKLVPYTSSGSTQLYEGLWGNQDAGPTIDIGWHGANNTIFTNVGYNFSVHYLSFAPDSLILDYLGIYRYFFNKSNTPPTLNNRQIQLTNATP